MRHKIHVKLVLIHQEDGFLQRWNRAIVINCRNAEIPASRRTRNGNLGIETDEREANDLCG